MPEEYCKSLSDLLAREYGARTDYRVNPLVADVDIAVTQIFGMNPKRVGYIVVNLSVNNIYMAPDEGVTAARGILLTPTGGSFSMVWSEDFELVSFPWWGTAAANNSAVISMEIFLV